MFLRRYCSAIALSLGVLCTTSHHVLGDPQSFFVTNRKGDSVFQLRFFNGPQDGNFAPSLNSSLIDPIESEKTFTGHEIQTIRAAFSYWAEVIQPSSLPETSTSYPGQTIVNIGHVPWYNNAAVYGKANLGMVKKPVGDYGAHAYIYLGDILEPQRKDYQFSQRVSPQEKVDLFTAIVHEFAHILYPSKVTRGSPHFPSELTPFEQHLYDADSRKARPNMPICYGESFCGATGYFRAQGMTFRGPMTEQVLKGDMEGVTREQNSNLYAHTEYPTRLKGIPVRDDFVHLELINSVISHEPFRNYSMFMEAELAMLQDLGYTIDRRNFFGYSIYENYGNITNNAPFFKRVNGETQRGIPNDSPLGIGLHVYGKFNRILQQSDLWADGPGAAGIRMDGTGNRLIIAADAQIRANGINGQGLMVSDGTYQTIIHKGDIRATGKGGIGAAFDFGGSTVGRTGGVNSKGSYSENLYGPLVNLFLISGHLQGTKAALFIGPTAHVQDVHVVRGAELVGDIISYYNPGEEDRRFTSLIFGGNMDDLDLPDPSFDMGYAWSMEGKSSLFPIFRGGITHLTSEKSHNVYSMTIEPKGTLKANGNIRVKVGKVLFNEGTLIPSPAHGQTFGALTLLGDYRQSAKGYLHIAFNSRNTDSLLIKGSAKLDGVLILAPHPDFYPENWVSPSPFLRAHSIEGDFFEVTSLSPTLEFTTLRRTDGRFETYHVQKTGIKKFGPELGSSEFPEPESPASQIHIPPVISQNQGNNSDANIPISAPDTCSFSKNTCIILEKLKAIELASQSTEPETQIHEPPVTTESQTNSSQIDTQIPAPDVPSLSLPIPADVCTIETCKVMHLIPQDGGDQALRVKQRTKRLVSEPSAASQQEQEEVYDVIVPGDSYRTTSGFTRPWNAYSRYAADANGRAAGHVLRRLVRTAAGDPALETLYTALDFSALDGSQIRTALAQMTPVSYTAVYGAATSREQQANDILSALPSPTWGTPSPWQIFAMPFGERGHQNSTKDLRVPYSGTERGLMFGIEHRFSPTSTWLWGLHSLVTQGDLSIKAEDAARLKGTGGAIGLQVRYAQTADKGFFLNALARVGFQRNDMTRQLTIGSYGGSITAEWTSWTTAASAMGGYLVKLTDHLSLGPVAGLDHTAVSFPTIIENGTLPTALTLKDATFSSAQGRLGAKARIDVSSTFTLEAQATWDQELLDKTLTQEAEFAAYPATNFTAENPVVGGQTLTLQAQATYAVTQNFTIAGRSSKILRSGANITVGQLSGVWKF